MPKEHAMSELDPLLLRAFSEARAERPRSGEGKARTLSALGLSTKASSTSQALSRGAASGVAAGGSRFLWWPWWMVGLALLATRGESFRADETLATTSSGGDAPQVRPVDAPAAQVAIAAPDVASAPTISVDELPNVASTNRLAPCASCKAATALPVTERTPAPESAAPAGASLRDEIEAIERASRALSQRRCALAGRHLADYRARFPSGKLQREAEVVAIEIAGRSGQAQQARSAARAFVARFPDSPYALRLAPWLRNDTTEAGVVTCTDAPD
jgi:TolA-binding protein